MLKDHPHDYLPAAGHDVLLPAYDLMARLYGMDSVYHTLIQQAELADCCRVLEIGCGTGNLSIRAKRAHPRVEVVGCDPDPRALRRAQRKARALSGIRFQRGYAQQLPYADGEFDRRVAGRIFDGVRQEVVDDRAQFVRVADHDGGPHFRLERDHPRQRGQPLFLHHPAHDVGECDRTQRCRFHRACLMIGEQVLDQLLQRQRVVPDDAHDVVLFGRQLAAHIVAQQLRALAHRGERRLELVRHVPQESVLLLFEVREARAQPLEPLPEVAQVLRSVAFDAVSEVRRAHAPDREIHLANRARDQHREDDAEG